jgi:hypothetical protein
MKKAKEVADKSKRRWKKPHLVLLNIKNTLGAITGSDTDFADRFAS